MTASRISILPESITNKIAAGEVVERPASVIKELMENSLDAGATDITVEIRSGGLRFIQIRDNGCGMSRDDALLSLERHATSKIRSDADLSSITTLGFRGEALPSIASVSRFNIKTRTGTSIEGTEIIVEGGKVKNLLSCGMPQGTIITVENLFFNTPARLKFMKRPETEAAHIADTVTRIAMARHDASFTLISDERIVISVKKSDLKRRISQLAGTETASALIELSYSAGGVEISGFVSSPQLTRSTTAQLFTYINGRFVRDKVVQHGLLSGYRGVIDRGRYPLVALFIALNPAEVDVNVHPTKHEVRFRRQTVVHDAIQSSIERSLSGSPWLKHEKPLPPPHQTGTPYLQRIENALTKSENNRRSEPQLFPNTYQTTAPNAAFSETAVHYKEEEQSTNSSYFADLAIIGQFHGEYIICQSRDELIIIDQHAASERIAYQRLKEEKNRGSVESQRLLVPETIEVSYSQAETASANAALLSGCGFEVEPFGGNTIIISAIPAMLRNMSVKELVTDILDELAGCGSKIRFEEVEEALFARVACHSVVRGVHRLEPLQIRELLYQMDRTDFAASCPHGRPVSHSITNRELEKIFKR